jgi:hypothetical protein
MSRYGLSIYDEAYYGDTPSVSLIAPVFTQQSSRSGAILLRWQNPAANTWLRIRLVRNSYGLPVNQDDGLVLMDSNSGPAATGTVDPAVTSFSDSNVAAPSFYYYSLFVSTLQGITVNWTRSADLIAAAVMDHGSGDYLLSRLPSVYSNSQGAVDETTSETLPIRNFLGIFGADLNRINDYLNALYFVEDPEQVHGALLPYLVKQWGFDYEPNVGMRQNRVLAKDATYLNAVKGTDQGVTALASALTGWGARLRTYVNLMLDSNNSSFDQSAGSWLVTVGTAVQDQNTTVYPAGGTACLELTVSSTSLRLCTVGADRSAILYGIPVKAGVKYTASSYFRSKTTSVTPVVNINWYDGTGTLISTSTGTGGTATTLTDFTARESINGVAAPPNAQYAAPEVFYPTLVSGDVQYLGNVQFEASLTPSASAPARRLDVVVAAPRINEALNSGFDNDTAQWSVATGTLTHSTAVTYNGGSGSGLLVPSASGSTISETVQFDEGIPYIFALQVFSTYLTSGVLSVQWLSANGTPTVTSAPITLQPNVWTQLVFPAGIPAPSTITGYATSGYGVGPYGGGGFPDAVIGFTVPAITGSPATTNIYVDDVQFEKASTFASYFDARLNPGDVLYEGGSVNARIHQYPNYLPRKTRLDGLLANYVPLGRPYVTLFGQSRSSG